MADPVLLGELGRSASEDEVGNRTYRRVFKVSTDNASYGARKVASVLGIQRGDYYEIGVSSDPFYEIDTGAFVRSINAEQLFSDTGDSDDGTIWICTVEYGPINPERAEDPGSTDPLLDEPTEEWDSEDREELIDQDRFGNPVLNSAGDRFDPPLTDDVSRSILVIERNERTFDDSIASVFRNAINLDTFRGYEPGTVKIKRITARRVYNTQIGVYFRVRYEFHINEEGWLKRPLNAGMRQLSSDGTTYEAILVQGMPVSEPVPLDENGRALPPDGTPIFLEFEVGKWLSFAELNLG